MFVAYRVSIQGMSIQDMKHKVDLVCIQETKKESFDKLICQSMWGDSYVSWDFVPSIQASGGLLCLWNNSDFQVDGDCNSGYFHRIINYRRAFNAIPGIFIDGVWVQQPNTVKNATANFFHTRFTEQDYSRPYLDGVPFNFISHSKQIKNIFFIFYFSNYFSSLPFCFRG